MSIFQFISVRTSLTTSASAVDPTKAFGGLLEALRTATPTCVGLFLGARIETPEIWNLAIHWPTHTDAESAVNEVAKLYDSGSGRAASGLEWTQSLRDAGDELVSNYFAVLSPAGDANTDADQAVTALLTAPCTELVTQYGVEDACLGYVREFAGKLAVAQLAGCHGLATGPVYQPSAAPATAHEETEGVLMILGWDSKEQHEKVKAEDGNAIIENVHLLRAHKSWSMWHVPFAKLL